MRLILESRAARVLVSLLAGAVAAVVVPLGNLWLKCQQPASEACVWSRDYLPLSLALTFVTMGIPVFVVTFLVLRRYRGTRLR